MLRRFHKFDTHGEKKEHRGTISFAQMQKCFWSTSWLTPKESNLLLRDYVMKYGYDEIDYLNFEEDLYSARYELANSCIMDTDLGELEDYVLTACNKLSKDGKTIELPAIYTILKQSKSICLTGFQLAVLLGFSNP